jgi:hypothetical protein
MGFYRPAGHFELAGNLGIITTLQQQFHNLLFTRSKPDRLLPHHPPFVEILWLRIGPPAGAGAQLGVTRFHSIHDAILRRKLL